MTEPFIKLIEDSIVLRLTELEEVGCRVLNLPESNRPAVYSECLFFYAGRSLKQTGNNSYIYTLRFVCNFMFAGQRSHSVAYPPLVMAAKLLHEYSPLETQQGRLMLVSEDYRQRTEENGFRWWYDQNYEMDYQWIGKLV